MFSSYTRRLSSKLYFNCNLFRQFSLFPQEKLKDWNDLYTSTQKHVSEVLKCKDDLSEEIKQMMSTNFTQCRLSIVIVYCIIEKSENQILLPKCNDSYVNLQSLSYSSIFELCQYSEDMNEHIWNTCSLILKSMIETKYPDVFLSNFTN